MHIQMLIYMFFISTKMLKIHISPLHHSVRVLTATKNSMWTTQPSYRSSAKQQDDILYALMRPPTV